MKRILVLFAVILMLATGLVGQQWQAENKVDALTGKSYVVYTLVGKYLRNAGKLMIISFIGLVVGSLLHTPWVLVPAGLFIISVSAGMYRNRL
jgi:hypothetical protein